MNILFTTDYGNGIGDFLVKIYGVCHLKKYITENVVCDNCSNLHCLQRHKSIGVLGVVKSPYFGKRDVIYCSPKDITHFRFDEPHIRQTVIFETQLI